METEKINLAYKKMDEFMVEIVDLTDSVEEFSEIIKNLVLKAMIASIGMELHEKNIDPLSIEGKKIIDDMIPMFYEDSAKYLKYYLYVEAGKNGKI